MDLGHPQTEQQQAGMLVLPHSSENESAMTQEPPYLSSEQNLLPHTRLWRAFCRACGFPKRSPKMWC